MNRWQDIWNKKSVVDINASDEFDIFCELKRANGFDVEVADSERYYRAFYENWLSFYEETIRLAGHEIDGVYEIGCGSGVNLVMFKNRILRNCRWGGIDYSASMIESAKKMTGSDDFICCGADQISIEPKYDIVMAESVFQYFESLEYAKTVLEKMIKKSGKLTYLGEVHDKQYENDLVNYRRSVIPDYDSKYADLSKLFIAKEWIEKIAMKNGKKVLFSTVNNPEYINARFIYNCYIY